MHTGNQKILFSTHSAHKLQEVHALLEGKIEFLSLKDIGFHKEIPEPFETLEENAQIKAETLFKETGMPVFSEDTGLFVEALQGMPGVFSARYAGEPSNADANIDKLLGALHQEENRKAYFKTVICFITPKEIFFFEGICPGHIALERSGEGGFGYDPVFIPENYSNSFASLPPQVKQEISHRALAFKQFAAFLEQHPESYHAR